MWDFERQEFKRDVPGPRMREWLDRTAHLPPIASESGAAQIIRELRDEKDRSADS